MSGPRFYPSFKETSQPTFPDNPISPLSASLMSFDASQFSVSAPLSIMEMEKPFVMTSIRGSKEVFTHRLGVNIFGNTQSLRQYQEIMNTIEKEWPALSKLINAQHPNSRTAVFTCNSSNFLAKEMVTNGIWNPVKLPDPRLKQFNTSIMVNVDKGKFSISAVGHEWWHEIQSLNHTIKSGRSPHDLPVSLSAYLNSTDESAIVNCWWKGVEKYRNAKLPVKDPRYHIYKEPLKYFEKYFETALSGTPDEAATAWSIFTQEIGSHMVSARLEHGHEAIQEYAKELGQLIDEKLGVQAFTEPCPEKFKTRLWSATKRNAGKALIYAGRAFAALGFGLDVYQEYTQLKETEPNKAAHALINGTMRNLVGQGIAGTGLAEALFNDTSHLGSAAEATEHIESVVGKERLQQILTKGHQARGLENMCLPMSEDQILAGEERQIYFSYMNACSRSIQEAIQNPIAGVYDTVKQSISEYLQSFSPEIENLQKAVSAFGNEIANRLSNLTGWTPKEQKELLVNLRSKAGEIFTNIPKMAYAGVAPTKNETPSTEQTSTPQELLLRRWMEEFQSNNEATLNISTQGISEDILESDKPLTEEQLKTIASELDSTSKQVLPSLKKSGQIGEEVDKGLSAKCDDPTKGEYFQKIAEGVAKFSASLYMDAERRLAQKRFDTEQEQAQLDFDRRKKRSEAWHYQEVTGISLSSIERNVWNVLHPSGNFRRSLADMARYMDVCSQREKEVRTLIHKKTEIKKNLGKQDIQLNSLGASIKRKFGKMIDARTKAIKEYNKAQKALGAIGSFFSLAAVVPAFTPVALGAATVTGAAAQGVATASTHQEKRRMREEFKFRNARERVQNIRDEVAGQAHQQNSDIYHLKQEETHLRQERAYIMESNIAIVPAVVRGQLDIDKEKIAENIEEAKKTQQQTDDSIQKTQEEIAKYKEALDNNTTQAKTEEIQTELADSLTKGLKNHPEKLLRGTRGSSTHGSKKGKGSSARGSKKRKGSSAKGSDTKDTKTDEPKPKTPEILPEQLFRGRGSSTLPVDKTSIGLKLAEAQEELSRLQSQSLDLGTHLTTLTKEQKENQAAIEREARLAGIKDTGYKAIMRQFNKYEPVGLSDEEMKKYQELQTYFDELFSTHHSLKGSERAAALGMLNGLEELFQELTTGSLLRGLLETLAPHASAKVKDSVARVPLYFQYVTKLGEQFYKLYDAYDTLKLAHGALNGIRANHGENPSDIAAKVEKEFLAGFEWLESDKLKNPFQMLMNNKTIKDFGPLRYVHEVLVPAIHIATSTLATVRIMNHIAHGCPRTLSPEEMKLDKIQEFLAAFSEHLDQKLMAILNYLGKDHQDILDTIHLMRSELGTVANEIVAEIDYARQQILSKQEEINYNDHTVRIKTTGNKISKARTKLELSTQAVSTDREAILKFFKKIHISLKHDCASDINTGVTLGHGNNVDPLVNIQNAVKNPDMYTGLIAFKTKFPKPIGSLYLFNLIYQNYLHGLKLADPYLKNSGDPLSTLISDCARLLETQGRALNEFCRKADVIISNCRMAQDEILKTLQQPLNSMRNEKALYIQHITLQERERYSKTIKSDLHYVGAQKFRLAQIFCTTSMVETATPQTYGTVKQFASEATKTTLINGAQTAIGVGLLGPGYLVITAIGEAWSLMKATNAAITYSESQALKKKHDGSTLLSQLDTQVSTEPTQNIVDSFLFPKEKLIMTVWLKDDGKLCSKISRVGGDVFSKTALSSPSESYEVVKGKTSFEISYRLLEKNIKVISNNSCIKIAEIQKLNPKHHLPNRTKYDVALKKLLSDYQAWLQPNSQIQNDNSFYSIKECSEFLRSSDLSTVPLAFPKELLKELENRMDPDRILMEATGIGFLEPSYSFTKDKNNDGYVLRIQYHFIDKENPAERKLYEEFDVAYVDGNTVKSFAKPSFSGVQKVNDPNLNELLIQLFYTNKDLGAPGDLSICLGENRWVAPSMRAFPGFYKLWRHYPECAVHFDSRFYTEDMSFALTMCAGGKLKTATSSAATEIKELVQSVLKRSRSTKTGINVSIWKAIRKAKEDLSETKRLLEENYTLLIAYCRLISSLDGHSLRQKLESDFGLLDPSHFSSLYDFIVGGIHLPALDNNTLANFKTTLQLIPSQYLALMNQDHQTLPITVETAPPKPTSPKTANSTKTSEASTSQLPEDAGIDLGSPLENRHDEGYLYSGTDIEIIQTFLFKDEHSVNLMSPMNPEQLAQCSKQIQDKLVDGKPLLFTFNPNGGHYIAVAMMQTGDKQVKILCKDSMGGTYDQSLNIFPQDYAVFFASNTNKEQFELGDVGCGIYALDNLRTMIHNLKKSDKKDTFIAGFSKFKGFCSSIKMKDLRKNAFAIAYQKGGRLIEQRAKKMENLRSLITAHHQTEIDAVAEKIRVAFPLRSVKNVQANDEIKKSDYTNTIFVEFALRSNTIENNSYEYVYRVYSSNDISLDDLKTTVSAIVFPEDAYEIESTLDKIIGDIRHYTHVIKISSDRADEMGIVINGKYGFENNRAQEGVNLVGECPTNGNKVYIPHGYEDIDLSRAAHLSKCPCCQKNAVNVKEIFFKNCQWETTTFDSEGNSTETKGTGSHTLNLNAVEFVEFKAKKII